ncbi:MAG TPA: nickel pincer cofactor biosynthesis protein LarC [Dehalococcoidia bacterium]|nr:nickel pincer cofactor biosynthesis protein LarC [Dehalococcoidia bacterium]
MKSLSGVLREESNMAKVAYFDCFSGCSGDMVLGALIDAGLPLKTLEKGLSNLAVQGYKLSAKKVKRSAITATKFTVTMDETEAQPVRSLEDVLRLIKASKLPKKVKNTASAIFQRLGEAESKIHGVPLEKVYFHEIGAVDSIIDIVGVAFGLDALKIEHFYSSPLPLGSGSVLTAHGILPVPAPATLRLIEMSHAPIADSPKQPQAELVTPTGAAIVTTLASFGRPGMTIEKVGYGAGTRDFEAWPNVMRIWIGEEIEPVGGEGLILLETNIDDMSPEIYGYLMEKLFAMQALDVWFTPIQMKKNRPAVMLSVLASRHAESDLTQTIMRETSTLGIRVSPVFRHIAEREIIEFDSTVGHTKVKVKRFKGDILSIHPEYEECRRIALERNIPLQEVYRIIETEARRYVTG